MLERLQARLNSQGLIDPELWFHRRHRRPCQALSDGRVRFDEEAYRRRSVVEQCVGWPKECRAVATRFDKLAVDDLATVQWAMVQR
jgi:transposase